MFSDIEDANLTGRSKAPLFLGVMVILAIAAFVLIQAGFITIPPIFTKQNSVGTNPTISQPAATAPAQTPATTPAPAPGAPTTSQLPAPATQTAAPAASATAPAQTEPAPLTNPIPGQAPVQTQPAPAAQPATSQAAPAKQPDMTGQSTPDTPHDTRAPRSRNASGEIAKRVMPNASPGALSSMRAPVVVTLRVSVNRNGFVQDAAYISPGAGNYFAKIAHRAALEWKFDPPLSEGRPQPSSWDLRFYFSRSNIEANAEERLR
jgi:outer membrane biosynthesis protein TonB